MMARIFSKYFPGGVREVKKTTLLVMLVAATIVALSGTSSGIGIDPTKFYSISNYASSTALWTINPYTVSNQQVAITRVLDLHLPGSTAPPGFMTNTIAFSPSNVLYGWDTGSKRLYTINFITGQIDYIGASGINSTLDTQWINGMSFVKTGTGSAILYGISGATNELYTIDTTSGQASVAGHTNVDIMNSGMGINFQTNELYAVSGDAGSAPDILLKINPGALDFAQVIGNLGHNYNDVSAEFDQNGNLYTVRDRNRLYSLDIGTGQATFVGNLSDWNGFQSTNLAHPWPDTAPVPEPGTLVLLGSGLFGLAGYGRKKLRK